MRPFRQQVVASAGGISYSKAYVVDNYTTPCNIGIGVEIDYGTGSAMYSVQHTFDDPFSVNLNSSAAAGNWLNNDFLVSATSTNDTNYAFAPTAIRLALFPDASAAATINIIQSGPRG